MTSQLTQIHAQQHVSDLLRVAELDRVARTMSGAAARTPVALRLRRLLVSPTLDRRAQEASA